MFFALLCPSHQHITIILYKLTSCMCLLLLPHFTSWPIFSSSRYPALPHSSLPSSSPGVFVSTSTLRRPHNLRIARPFPPLLPPPLSTLVVTLLLICDKTISLPSPVLIPAPSKLPHHSYCVLASCNTLTVNHVCILHSAWVTRIYSRAVWRHVAWPPLPGELCCDVLLCVVMWFGHVAWCIVL